MRTQVLFFSFFSKLFIVFHGTMMTMRKIPIENWKENVNGNTVDTNLLLAINAILTCQASKDITGFTNFRTYVRIGDACDKADKTNVLELEEADYEFLKKKFENNIPAAWGLNPDIVKAIDEFMNAQEIKK